jgi:pyridoxal phosphate enzyme (YggS family)
MLTAPQNLSAALAAVRARIASATKRAGRDIADVTLIGVSKGHSAAAISKALSFDLVDFGENYVQEAAAKQDAVRDPRAIWHFIGALQSNKTRVVADRYAWVHTIDRLKLAERLSDQRSAHLLPLNICLQVNLGAEASKGGVPPERVRDLALGVVGLDRLRLRGLMCIPPEESTPEQSRQWFRELRSIREDLRRAGLMLDALSMGMSADFEVAIEEGATHVRVGTALFGPRS